MSVRDAREARAARSGGADVIDVKEPGRGPLGAADFETIAAVVQEVNGRAPVTAAAGELIELVELRSLPKIPPGVSLFKLGLAGCRTLPDWRRHWQTTVAALAEGDEASRPRPVGVIYADWQNARAPGPDEIATAAIELGCPAILIDTWDKSTGTLFDHWPADEIQLFLRRLRSCRQLAVLAGSLAGKSFAAAVRLGPDYVAVRGAACDSGRRGSVSSARVRSLRSTMAAATPMSRRGSGAFPEPAPNSRSHERRNDALPRPEFS